MNKSHNKSQREFKCIHCDYHTCKTSSWKKHIMTKKHLMIVNANVIKGGYACMCGKNYSHASGLSRHKKRCILTYKKKKKKQLLKKIVNYIIKWKYYWKKRVC